jgi:ABC-type multidrug transport system permease subunit
MRFILTAAAKDLKRRLADPPALAIWIGIPVLLGGVLSLVAGGDGAAPRAQVLVVDQDDTLLSGLLLASGGRGGMPIDTQRVSLDEGRRRIAAGDATALLVVPKGFQTAVIDDTPARLELVTNPAQRILPRIVEEALEILVEAGFYAQRLFGPAIRRITGTEPPGGPSDATVASISVEINQQLTQLQNVLIPPAIALEMKSDAPQAAPSLNFAQLFLPGVLFMSFLFIAQGMSGDVWAEKRQGTLRRALTTPQSASRLLAGKLVAGTALMAMIGAVGLVAMTAAYGIAWVRVPVALLWCTFAGAALLALMTLVHTLASSERGSEMISTMILLPLMMLGGSFFPFESMPAWMAAVGQWTPNGLAVVRLKELLYGEPSAAALATAALGIGVPAAVAFALTARRLRGSFARG